MCVCLCLHVCVCVFVCVCAFECVSMCACVCVSAWMYAYVFANQCGTCVGMCVYICKQMCITNLYALTKTCMNIETNTTWAQLSHTQACMHTHTHAYCDTRTHTKSTHINAHKIESNLNPNRSRPNFEKADQDDRFGVWEKPLNPDLGFRKPFKP